MRYFGVENLSNLCKLIVCSGQTLRSTKQTRNANQYVIFSGCFGTYYELQQILPEDSISFNYLVSELTWLH